MKQRTKCLFICVTALAGCAGPNKPVFDGGAFAAAWPKPPDRARIRYIGQLSGEQSLNAPKTAKQVFGEVLSGPQPKWGFSTPTGVAARGSKVYVADGQNHAVCLLDTETRAFKVIRDAGGTPLEWPADVCLTATELIVVDSKRPGIYCYDLDGNFRRNLGSSLKRPCSASWNAKDATLWVVDAADHRCAVFDSSGNLKSQFGQRGTAAGQFNFPAGIACADGGAMLADSMNFRVQILDPIGTAVGVIGKKGDAAGDFALPRDVAIDSEGHIYVLDNQFENIQIFDRSGQLLMAWGQEGRGPGEFYLPSGISIDEQDRIWIADTYNRRVQVFQYLAERAPTTTNVAENKTQ